MPRRARERVNPPHTKSRYPSHPAERVSPGRGANAGTSPNKEAAPTRIRGGDRILITHHLTHMSRLGLTRAEGHFRGYTPIRYGSLNSRTGKLVRRWSLIRRLGQRYLEMAALWCRSWSCSSCWRRYTMPEQQATTPAPMPIEQTNTAQKIMVAITGVPPSFIICPPRYGSSLCFSCAWRRAPLCRLPFARFSFAGTSRVARGKTDTQKIPRELYAERQ